MNDVWRFGVGGYVAAYQNEGLLRLCQIVCFTSSVCNVKELETMVSGAFPWERVLLLRAPVPELPALALWNEGFISGDVNGSWEQCYYSCKIVQETDTHFNVIFEREAEQNISRQVPKHLILGEHTVPAVISAGNFAKSSNNLDELVQAQLKSVETRKRETAFSVLPPETPVSLHPREFPALVEPQGEPLELADGFLSGLGTWVRWDSSRLLTDSGLTAAPYVLRW